MPAYIDVMGFRKLAINHDLHGPTYECLDICEDLSRNAIA